MDISNKLLYNITSWRALKFWQQTDGLTDGLTDIGDSKVAFAFENSNKTLILIQSIFVWDKNNYTNEEQWTIQRVKSFYQVFLLALEVPYLSKL